MQTAVAFIVAAKRRGNLWCWTGPRMWSGRLAQPSTGPKASRLLRSAAVVGLEAGQTMREDCAAAGVDPETDRAVIGLPLYAMRPGVALKLRPLLPVH